MRPAGPTNGCPALSSWSPGCSPTSIMAAGTGPSPNTVRVALRQRSQARHPAARSRTSSNLLILELLQCRVAVLQEIAPGDDGQGGADGPGRSREHDHPEHPDRCQPYGDAERAAHQLTRGVAQ